ncbi:hypothetical protein PPYR_01166 [Photinus pyralis]|uniref:Endonuclease/exonuclease/phosphatase domain-containing protein n=1 Tax=Photinus pyralis TaxID=7054 RepID=A0A5N4B3Q1_PHOPY|nr:hypothetical protein PPYR_01166 [Photinus pyralis]
MFNYQLSRVIIAGDFNIKFNLKDKFATMFCDLLSTFGYSQTIFSATREGNCLDNIFINFDTTSIETSVPETGLSDHLGQTITIPKIFLEYINDNKIVNTSFRSITAKGSYLLYMLLTSCNWDFLDSHELSCDIMFDTFFKKFIDAFVVAFPFKKCYVRSRDNKVVWFNEKLKRIRDRVAFINDVYRVDKSYFVQREKKRLRMEYRYAIKTAKCLANDNFISNSSNPGKAAWQFS